MVGEIDSSSAKRILPWLVAVALFMEQLDATILNTGVPVIAEALRVEPLSMKSVLSSYTLSLALFIPVSSWVADRFGTRRVFAFAIGLFTLGSFLCGISSDIRALVASRIIQGCGGAMMVPVGRLTLVRTFAKSELVQAMSFVAIPSLIGPLLGPLAGGLIVHFLHWRMIFFVNLPIGILGLCLVYRFLPDFRSNHRTKLDVVGSILFGSGIALISYILEVFGENNLNWSEIAGLFSIAALLLMAYGFHVKMTLDPILKLNLLRIRTLRIGVVGNLTTRLGVGGLPFLLPLFYQIGLGYSPVQSGLLMMPQSLAAIILKVLVPRILTHLGFRNILVSNTILIGFYILLYSLIGPSTPVWVIVLLSSIYGFFSSLQYTAMNTLVFADISDHDASQASTIGSTVQQMSMSFGVATASLLVAYFIPDRLRSNPEYLLHGLHEAFVLLGCFTALSAIWFYKLKNTDGESISLHKTTSET